MNTLWLGDYITKYLKDSGKHREEYKILYEFLPGQLDNHVPGWSSNNVPTFALTTKVSKIKNISQLIDNTNIYKLIKIETEELLKHTIAELAGISDSLINIEYYNTNVSADKHIIIELDIFPNVWELDLGHPKGNVFFRSQDRIKYSGTSNASQSYVVFCNSNTDYSPYITELDIPPEECVITRDNEPRMKKIIYKDGRYELAHAKGAPKNNPFDWRNRPRLATESSNYVPRLYYEVYSPDIESFSANKIVELWKESSILSKNQNSDDKLQRFANHVVKNREGFFEYQDDFPTTIKEYFSDDIDFNRFKEVTMQFFNMDAEQSERLKLAVIKIEADYNMRNNLFEIYHSDRFQIGNFALGYFSGDYYNPNAPVDDRPVLRRFPGHFNSAKSEFLAIQDVPLNKASANNWPIFFQLYNTEGLIFVASESVKQSFGFDKTKQFDALHTIAHSIIKNIPRYSGIEEGLLREYMFTEQPAFFIYTKEPGVFRTKGLDFILKKHMSDIFQDAKETLDCPFQILETSDMHKQGCGQCTMLPINCSNYNLNLNRLDAVNILANL